MKRALILTMLAVAAFVASAQDKTTTATTQVKPAVATTTASTATVPAAPAVAAPATDSIPATSTEKVEEQVVSMPKTDWLTAFTRVKIDGPMNVVLKRVATAEECRITYDTKGNITSKFKFEVDKKGALVVTEKYDPKRTSVTDITIYYNSLREVKIAHAKAIFENVIETDLFDLNISGGATVSLDIKTLDAAVECTGVSRLTLNGSTKYLTMRASTAKINCTELSVVSATIDASHSAEVRMTVSERLEATTSTGAKLFYKGKPTILRDHTVVFGGEIININ
ncbi:MAG: DUF2807 domain-containing protein [Alistipes sp.]|nr:DUF2807 domain-containing protein [Alistipes sp.]